VKNYMPFVRLALVRYQPNALDSKQDSLIPEELLSAKISKVVLTDFAQVLPNRSVSVTVNSDKKEISVSMIGPAPSFGPMNEEKINKTEILEKDKGVNRVELVLQTRDPKIDSDLAWTDSESKVRIKKITCGDWEGEGMLLWNAIVDSSQLPSRGANRLQNGSLKNGWCSHISLNYNVRGVARNAPTFILQPPSPLPNVWKIPAHTSIAW